MIAGIRKVLPEKAEEFLNNEASVNTLKKFISTYNASIRK